MYSTVIGQGAPRPIRLSRATRDSFLYLRQLVDAGPDGGGQDPDLFGAVVGRAESITDLSVTQAREQIGDPSGLSNFDVIEQIFPLPLVEEEDTPAFHIFQK